MSSPDVPDAGMVGSVGEVLKTLIEANERSPVLRILVKLNPALSLAEAGILGTYAYFQHQRLQVFANEFSTLGLNISKEDAKRREFFDAYTSTARHVLTESRDAKIRLFARLLGRFVESGCVTSIDRYEEHLLLLDEISEREFSLLLLLERHEATHPLQGNENRLERAGHFWTNFEADAGNELGIDSDNLQAILTRLARTGMYHEITGGYFDYGGGRGHLTPIFAEFLNALGIAASDARHFPPAGNEPRSS